MVIKMNLIKLLFILYLIPFVMLIKPQKIVYQKDVSEYCRRRVIPSVFLARNAIDSTSFIVHFSRAELPYSCSISVRTESGCNIIMVSKFNPQIGLPQACAANSPELLVHEMGETFGGYWGQLSERVIKIKDPPSKQYYTLKTTQSISTKEIVLNITLPDKLLSESPPTSAKKYYPKDDSEGDDDSIKVEVPLIDVYGKFIPNLGREEATEDPDAMFDLRYDVTPQPGVAYDTSMMPLVQFSAKKIVNVDGRRGDDSDEARFDLDIIEKYTPDKRLTSPHYESTKRLRFKKFRQKMTTNNRRVYFEKNLTKGKLQPPQFSSHKTDFIIPTTKTSNTPETLSKYHWKTIEELMNKVNQTSVLAKETYKSSINDAQLQQIAIMEHNNSIYLKSNLSQYLNSVLSTSTFSPKIQNSKYTTVENIIPTKTIRLNKDIFTSLTTKHSTLELLSSLPTSRQVSSEINENSSLMTSSIDLKKYMYKTTIPTTQNPKKSLVDHESWENVVQAAPDMAVLLNVTDTIKRNIKQDTTLGMDDYYDGETKRYKRKRRDIYAIEIENARPYNVTTRFVTEHTTEKGIQLSDMQEFAQLVELQDDDLYGRVALRYVRQYVGPVIYNICEYSNTTKKQHVHLFNASRIVLTINNFSHLAGMTLVLTTARALLSGESRCPGKNIECQVSGARVCIDSMSACDGVPNCGSYDIYDEDRLMCGASEGLQHNVYVAAFTFLAVLLTVLYAVHYWLKRCVPKVADAFFIYTNGTENVLYLQPIMRSPHDTGDDTKLFYHPGFFENDYDHFNEPKINWCRRFINILCCGLCIRKNNQLTEKQSVTAVKIDNLNLDHEQVYSYTHNEILKMFNTDGSKRIEAIKSIESLVTQKKVTRRERLSSAYIQKPKLGLHDSVLTLEDPFPEDYTDELGILKFLKEKKKLSSDSKSTSESKIKLNDNINISNRGEMEKEIHNYIFNEGSISEPGPSNVHNRIQTKQSLRKLRFDNMTTMIPASIDEVDEDESDQNYQAYKEHRHSTFIDAMLGRQGREETNESLGKKDHARIPIRAKKQKKVKQSRNL